MNGVHTDYIVRGSTTLGIYFLESGFGGRPSKVIYNRKHSAITRIELEEFDFDEMFDGATWFHVSGISLALNERVAKFAVACAKYCHEHNIKVSFDFNYRAKLWTVDEARPWYKEIMNYVDVCFASFYDCNTILEIPLDKGLENVSMHEKRLNVFPKAIEKYHLTYFFGTDRVVYSATENSLAGYYYSKNEHYLSSPIRFMIYDRIGGGDAFASGVIHGLLLNFDDPKYACTYGLNTSVLKHTIYGDSCLLSCDDIEQFMKTNGAAEVQR
jgi:2-dehydro-3-deoxygluconokinase